MDKLNNRIEQAREFLELALMRLDYAQLHGDRCYIHLQKALRHAQQAVRHIDCAKIWYSVDNLDRTVEILNKQNQ